MIAPVLARFDPRLARPPPPRALSELWPPPQPVNHLPPPLLRPATVSSHVARQRYHGEGPPVSPSLLQPLKPIPHPRGSPLPALPPPPLAAGYRNWSALPPSSTMASCSPVLRGLPAHGQPTSAWAGQMWRK
jgi:hypothetical protein